MSNTPQVAREYAAARSRAVCHQRTGRGLIEVTGSARSEWLNNLVTNVVKTLRPGEGNYGFAVNVQGRTVFDVDFLILEDRFWLDVDSRLIETGLQHLRKYIIVEDVQLADVSDQWRRIAVVGSAAHEAVTALGFGNLTPMAWLQHRAVDLGGAEARMVRNDFVGLPAAEFLVPASSWDGCIPAMIDALRSSGVEEAGDETMEVIRIEAGIPKSVEDIDDRVIPIETLQVERGVSYQKGCYLGQEVIERMRSHGTVSRQLVGVRIEAEKPPPNGSKICVDQTAVGQTRSGCWSEVLQSPVSLGYVKTQHAHAGTTVRVEHDTGSWTGTVMQTPLAG